MQMPDTGRKNQRGGKGKSTIACPIYRFIYSLNEINVHTGVLFPGSHAHYETKFKYEKLTYFIVSNLGQNKAAKRM